MPQKISTIYNAKLTNCTINGNGYRYPLILSGRNIVLTLIGSTDIDGLILFAGSSWIVSKK